VRKRKRAELYSNQSTDMHTSTISGDDIRKRYRSLLKELASLYLKMDRGTLVFNYGERVANTKPADLVRVLSEWSQKDLVDLSIRNIIVDAILSSENKQIGSGIICLLSLLHKDAYHNKSTSFRASMEDIEETVRYYLGDGLLCNVTLSLLNMGALGSSIRFDISNNKNFVLEAVDAVNIPGHVHPIFQQRVHKLELPYIVCVDGIIESLGEVDAILQGSSENRASVVICALGFHPDVVNTLSENWKENRLRVIPFIVSRWSDDSEMTALEACDRINLSCVAREKGDVISSKTLEEFEIVESVYISAQAISIQNDIGEARHIEVKIPNHMSKMAGLIEDRIRITLQACTGVAKWGLLSDECFRQLDEKHPIKLPRVSVSAAVIGKKSADACSDIIENMGNAIIPGIK